MRLLRALLAATAVAASMLLFATPASAQTDTGSFLKIDGIPGESSHETHAGEIDLLSWSFDATAGSGKAVFGDFRAIKLVDKASPKLLEALATGKHLKQAVLSVEKKGEKPVDYLVIKLQDVIVTSHSHSQSGDKTPTESFSLNYTKITYTYTPQNADGSLGSPIRTCWDLRANRAC